MKLIALTKYNVKVQFRNGFYYAYLFVIVMYLVILHLIPAEMVDRLLPILILSDPAMLGFFFIGGIMLLEKDDNIYESLFVTPLKLSEYMFSKIASLTLLGVIVSFIIAIVMKGLDFNYPLLLFAVILTSPLYILIGMIAASRAKNLNEYMVFTPFYILVFFVPLLAYFNATPQFFFYYLSPVQATIILFEGAFHGGIKLWEWIYIIGINAVYTFLAWKWAERRIDRYLLRKIG